MKNETVNTKKIYVKNKIRQKINFHFDSIIL